MKLTTKTVLSGAGGFALAFLSTLSGCAGGDEFQARRDNSKKNDAAKPHPDVGQSEAPDSATVPGPCELSAGEDFPDDDFVDSNCDGIDGTIVNAVFVSPYGDNTATGEKETPVASLQKGIELAQSFQKDVYVCNGVYTENLIIENTGVRIFGGYNCTNNWQRSEGRALLSPVKGVPITINAAAQTSLDRVELIAPKATGFGESSVAILALSSKMFKLHKSKVIASDGGPGEPGGKAQVVTVPALSGEPGQPADFSCDFTMNGPFCKKPALGVDHFKATSCPNQTIAYRGGRGGDGAHARLNLAPQPGQWGVVVGGEGGKPGKDGQPGKGGKGGKAGVPGAALGILFQGQYLPASGTDGTMGTMGQAGGGGGGGLSKCLGDVCSVFYKGSAGGQGGNPGCGGQPGQAGGGGGGSIAIIAVDSHLAISHTTLVTKRGGNGGAGSDGALGQPGGEGGLAGKASYSAYSGGKGGKGGDGGKGGPGGSGGGGPSVAILIRNSQTQTTAATFELGQAGLGGTGIVPGKNGITRGVLDVNKPLPK